MFVKKRDGRMELVRFDKITSRISRLCYGLPEEVVPAYITKKICAGVFNGVSTVEVDDLAAETAADLITRHPDYGTLAARIAVSNLHKQTMKRFSQVIDALHNNRDETGAHAPLVTQELLQIVAKHADKLDAAVTHHRDNSYSYFGFKTVERSYLLRIDGHVAERPQHMLMRVAVGIHGSDISAALKTYEALSLRKFTHASPTLFNAGTPQGQLSSCFLVAMKDDSIDGIYDTLKTCAQISKTAGGIGLHIHNIRAQGALISGSHGRSSGIIPMLRVFNNTARYVDQGGNKRPGAFAMYLEPWHADVFDFLNLRKNHGAEEMRARDLFYALWIPDLFMQRVEKGGTWSLFCPRKAPGLADVWGEEFEQLYTRYEDEGRFNDQVPAQELFRAILVSQIETGGPFMLYKDACNRKSNQKHLGTIKSSNLCTEIVQYSSPDEVAVCNLASVALPEFVNLKKVVENGKVVIKGTYDFSELHSTVKHVTRNLNKIIDVNCYPVPEAETSNIRHRPIAVGVQGLADVFMKLRLPYDSDEAYALNVYIFETIYHAACEASIELAAELGPYDSYEGSPASKGQLQYDLWDHTPSDLWDWDTLKDALKVHGMRNSLLVAPMPTASTSQILGHNECFEPYTSNIYIRRVQAGEFPVVNQWLMRDLMKLGMWDDQMKNRIVKDNGSIQSIMEIPEDVRKLYRTAWEIKARHMLDMSKDRGPFIDQSQSLNVFMQEITHGKITAMHFHGWRNGLKTGMYYLRTAPAAAAIQFTVDQKMLELPIPMPTGFIDPVEYLRPSLPWTGLSEDLKGDGSEDSEATSKSNSRFGTPINGFLGQSGNGDWGTTSTRESTPTVANGNGNGSRPFKPELSSSMDRTTGSSSNLVDCGTQTEDSYTGAVYSFSAAALASINDANSTMNSPIGTVSIGSNSPSSGNNTTEAANHSNGTSTASRPTSTRSSRATTPTTPTISIPSSRDMLVSSAKRRAEDMDDSDSDGSPPSKKEDVDDPHEIYDESPRACSLVPDPACETCSG